jgi:hypothetical protein
VSSFLFFALRNDFCPVYVIFQGLQFLIPLFKFQWPGLKNLNDTSVIMMFVLSFSVTKSWCNKHIAEPLGFVVDFKRNCYSV